MARFSIRRLSRRLSTSITFVLVLAVLGPVFAEFFVEYAKEQGFYSTPTARLDATMTALSQFVTQAWFLMLVALAVGLTAGLWIDGWLRRREAAEAFPKLSAITLGDPGRLDYIVDGIQSLKDIAEINKALTKETNSISRAMSFHNARVQFVNDFAKRRKLASGLAAKLNKFSRRVGVYGPRISDAGKRVQFNCRSAVEAIPIEDADALDALLGFAAVLERLGQTAENSVAAMEQLQITALGIKGISRDLNGAADFVHSTMGGICLEIRSYGQICTDLLHVAQAKAQQAGASLATQSRLPSPQLRADTGAGTPQ